MTSATKTQPQERDHVDRWLETIRERLPMLDPEVEGIVDRIGGLNRRFKRAQNETLAEFKLDHAEHKLLGFLNRQDEAYRSSPGKLARVMELSSGAITNRLDRMEEAGLLRRLPDPADRRGVLGAERDGEEAAERAPPPPDDRVRAARGRASTRGLLRQGRDCPRMGTVPLTAAGNAHG